MAKRVLATCNYINALSYITAIDRDKKNNNATLNQRLQTVLNATKRTEINTKLRRAKRKVVPLNCTALTSRQTPSQKKSVRHVTSDICRMLGKVLIGFSAGEVSKCKAAKVKRSGGGSAGGSATARPGRRPAKTNDQAKVKINVDKNARKTTQANAATFACAAQRRRRWRW